VRYAPRPSTYMAEQKEPRRRYEEARIFAINGSQMRICPELAVEIGFNESVLFLQLEFLISIRGEWAEDKKWFRASIRDLAERFPYWSIATINRTIQSLEDVPLRLIYIGNFNERKGDKTRWLAINLSEARKLKSITVSAPNSNAPSEAEGVETASTHDSPGREKRGGSETASTQNETGSSQDETGLNQNETTIDREFKENKDLESKEHTHALPPSHETDSLSQAPSARVCVPSKYSFKQCLEYAYYSKRNNLGIEKPEGWATVAFRTGAWDALLDDYFTPLLAKEFTGERGTGVAYGLSFKEACEFVELMIEAQGKSPAEIIAEMPEDVIDAAMRQHLIEKFVEPTAEDNS
jgi:hypothetical protein